MAKKKKRRVTKPYQIGKCEGCLRTVEILQLSNQWCSGCVGWVTRMAKKREEFGVAAIKQYKLLRVDLPARRFERLVDTRVVEIRYRERVHRRKAREKQRIARLKKLKAAG